MPKKEFNPEDVKKILETQNLSISDGNAIKSTLLKFKDKEYLEIRKFYMDNSGRFLPSKGVWIPIETEYSNIDEILLESIKILPKKYVDSIIEGLKIFSQGK
jgi:hypothetical protein